MLRLDPRDAVAALGVHAPLGASDKEAAALMQPIQAQKIDGPTINGIEGSDFGNQSVKDVDVVRSVPPRPWLFETAPMKTMTATNRSSWSQRHKPYCLDLPRRVR
jgi:hypothetical protein